MPSVRNDDVSSAAADDVRLKNGSKSLNEVRADMGLPLLEAEEADTPMLFTPQGAFFVTEEGIMDFTTGGVTDAEATGEVGETATEEPVEEPAEEPTEESEEAAPVEKSIQVDEKVQEAKSFLRWLNKYGRPNRAYRFKHLPEAYGETLNKFIEVEDFDGARWYAERYLV
jgi:hypothetical protein